MRKKIFVGLSGGVDSAVSAALLKEQGHEVVGAFIKIWQPEFIECTWREDRLDAMRVCAALGIPYREIDLSDEYKREVIGNMISSYRRGETPNPDVLCNKLIKFGTFAEWARAEGAGYVATGHYARVQNGTLLRGRDAGKDQSYFLHRLSSADLEHIIFPVGELQKSEVRAHARRFGLSVAEKHDSQGLCFAGAITLPEFLAKYIPLEKGSVLDTEGHAIGTHNGAALFTRGQRHGFMVDAKSSDTGRYYVISTDTDANTVTVSTDIKAAQIKDITIKEMQWIGDAPALPRTFQVQTRYRETPTEAELHIRAGVYGATFANPHLVSPGQSLVVYDGEMCLGGGEIHIA